MTRSVVAKIEDLLPTQEERFAYQMDLVFGSHPYYRSIFKKMGLKRSDIRGLNDLIKLPLTYKEDYITQPEAFRLDMGNIPGSTQEERTLWDVVFTAGSTYSPAPFYDSVYDHYARISQLKRTAEIIGITSEDTVMNLFPLTSVPHQGFLSAFYGTLAVGAKLISGFGGSFDAGFDLTRSSKEIIEMIQKQCPTVLWGIGFFLRRLIMVAQEQGRDFSSVRLVMPMGEGCPAGMREDIRTRMKDLGARGVKVLNGYGFTEMHGPSIECNELKGFHVPKPARYFFEFIDPVTLEPVPVGQPGLVVMTHLDRRGTCLLRYVVGDTCSMTYATCPECGRWEPKFHAIPYRTGAIIKIKGTLVNVSALYDVLSKIEAIEEYEIVAKQNDPSDPYSEDVLMIRIACEEGMRSQLAVKVTEEVRRTVEVTPKIEFVSVDHYADTLKDYKFKRFKDERKRER